MNLSSWLRRKRISDAAFARTLGVTQSTVLRLKRGERRPSIALMDKISSSTGGDVMPNDWLSALPEDVSAA